MLLFRVIHRVSVGGKLSDGAWHRVRLIISDDKLKLSIDSCLDTEREKLEDEECHVEAPGDFQALLGGLSSSPDTLVGGIEKIGDITDGPVGQVGPGVFIVS